MVCPRIRDISTMSSIAMTADRLVREEAAYRGIDRMTARQIVAREAGISPGTLENLLRGRLKYVERIADRLNALVIRKIEKRIAELEHELAIARHVSARPDEAAIFAAQSALDDAKRHIGRL